MRPFRRPARLRNRPRRAGIALLVLAALGSAEGFPAVRFGDAVPGIIRPSDLERIKRHLHLERFSVLAAVRLGAEEGREAILSEPLSEEALALVKEGCEAGAFCPDPIGFVASRVRVVLLRDNEVLPVLVVDQDVRGAKGPLVDLSNLGVEEPIFGWSGRAAAADGHVALVLTPLARDAGGRLEAATLPPLEVRWNAREGRFQFYDCVSEGDAGVRCEFRDEPGD
jgi:hypothetical protein